MDTHPSAPRPTHYLVCMDTQPGARVALRFACLRARAYGGKVDIVHVIPPSDLPTLLVGAERLREEQRVEVTQSMQGLADEAFALSGVRPVLIVREGLVGEEILATLAQNTGVNRVVLAVTPSATGRGTLVAWLAGQLGAKLAIPVILVPGNLTDDQFAALI